MSGRKSQYALDDKKENENSSVNEFKLELKDEVRKIQSQEKKAGMEGKK